MTTIRRRPSTGDQKRPAPPARTASGRLPQRAASGPASTTAAPATPAPITPTSTRPAVTRPSASATHTPLRAATTAPRTPLAPVRTKFKITATGRITRFISAIMLVGVFAYVSGYIVGTVTRHAAEQGQPTKPKIAP